MAHGGMKIGEVAKTAETTTKTIRYYELLGLLEKPERTESGYRMYSPDDVDLLEFIKKAKQFIVADGFGCDLRTIA